MSIHPDTAIELLKERLRSMSPEEFRASWEAVQPRPDEHGIGDGVDRYIQIPSFRSADPLTVEVLPEYIKLRMFALAYPDELDAILAILAKAQVRIVADLDHLLAGRRGWELQNIFRERRPTIARAFDMVAALLEARYAGSDEEFSERVNRFIDILEGWESLHASKPLAASA